MTEFHDGCDEYPSFLWEKKSNEKQAVISYGKTKISKERNWQEKKGILVQTFIKKENSSAQF